MNGTPLWYFQKDQPSRTSSEGVVIEPAIGVGGVSGGHVDVARIARLENSGGASCAVAKEPPKV